MGDALRRGVAARRRHHGAADSGLAVAVEPTGPASSVGDLARNSHSAWVFHAANAAYGRFGTLDWRRVAIVAPPAERPPERLHRNSERLARLGQPLPQRGQRGRRDCVLRLWRKTLGARSQKGRVTWAAFKEILATFPLPEPVIHQTWHR
jgi:hypothetical protein